MTLWWIGNAVLLLVIVPVVVILLRGVLNSARAVTSTIEALQPVAEAASRTSMPSPPEHDPGEGQPDGHRRRELRRFTRHHPRGRLTRWSPPP
jgi:hypothetical protein